MKLRALISLAFLLLPAIVFAHDPFAASEKTQLPVILGALLLFSFWLSYCFGAYQLWPGWQRWSFFQTAALIMAFTVFGPFDEWAETNTAVHMLQHMFMLVVIPPLWVLARPLPQLAQAVGRPIIWLWSPLLIIAHYPLLTAAIQGLAIWFWHAPKLYLLALDNPWWHFIEHACFLLSAGLFWWSILHCSPSRAPRAFLALLFTLMHTGFLGALLTFAHQSIYGVNRNLEHQQLAGLIMWVVGGLPYFAAVCWCGKRWFEQMLRTNPLPEES
ncbi:MULTISPECIES: cytochrome c oxidase assembly protein [unclassified Legionella]|uniref:cytochrome c oxidase assembly protein n=1 Tax=unclassified Legionella TaxID=2622702 RepID=UPI00105633FC|nr:MULTISPECIES: cytochrome c oxidase assembly protein [unclassified Legionella]MDI9817583.1 cytochrome c oxidase assembly protein [Legionella sp. PL877]